MNNKDLIELKVDVAKQALRIYIHDLVLQQEAVLHINKEIKTLQKKGKDLTEDDEQRIKRGEDNKKEYMKKIGISDQRIANYRTIIEAYSKDKSVDL